MSTKARIQALREAQKERIRVAVRKGLSQAYICSVEGTDAKTVKDVIRKMKAAGEIIPRGKTPTKPYHLTSASSTLRTSLGGVVDRLIYRNNYLLPVEGATAIGIPEKLLKAAANSKWDWKLSELERLAKHQGTDLTRFLLEMLRPDLIGSKGEVAEWDRLLTELSIGPSASGSINTRP